MPAKTEEILLDYASSGTLAASGTAVTAPVQVSANPGGTNGSLNTNELGEFLSEELSPPFDANGSEQALESIQLSLDGTGLSAPTWSTSGRASLCSTPPGYQVLDGIRGQGGPGNKVYFSPTGYGGILEAIAILQSPLPGEEPQDTMGRAMIAAAVPRYSKRAIVQYSAGLAAVTGQWLDRWWGMRYLAEEIDDLYSSFSLGGNVRFTDPFGPSGANTFSFTVPSVQITSANWSLLPGGAASPVQPFRRTAIATQATGGQQAEYDLTWTGAGTTQVGGEYNSMDFDLSSVTDTLYVLYHMQVRLLQMSAVASPVDLSVTAQNLATQYLRQQGYQPSALVPKNTLPASDIDNPQMYGWAYPTYSGKQPARYRAPRALAGAWRVAAGNRTTLAFGDNGTSQAANTVGATMAGVYFNPISNLSIS